MALGRAVRDGGNNFGRIARYGVINAQVDTTFQQDALGIPLSAWQRFLSIFSEQSSATDVQRSLDRIESDLVVPMVLTEAQREEVLERIRAIVELLSGR